MKRSMLTAAMLALGLGASSPLLAEEKPAEAWTVPDIDKLPNDKFGQLVRQGRDLIDQTPKFIGPEVANRAKRYSGNNLSCSNCHLAAGTVKFASPFVGTFADYPQYRQREDTVQTIEGRINGCMERSMNGKALPLDSPEMHAMVAYLKFMSTGVPVGKEIPGRGIGKVAIIPRAADPAQGKTVYDQMCAGCHGAKGEGVRVGKAGDAQGYVNPPLWGPDSYNTGAGMNRVIMGARFIKSTMPKGATFDTPLLTDEQAFDVSAYINSQPRPKKKNLEADFPNRKVKPADAAFPPYREGFTAQQHKYGPFKPIIEAREKALKAQ